MKPKKPAKPVKRDKNGNKHAGGPPKAEISLKGLEKLCEMQCTDAEIAAVFEVATKTIERRRKEPEFAEAMERGRLKGCVSLRRAQMKAALAGDRTMLIWMGKQLLGQRDSYDTQVTGAGGGPIEYLSVVLPRITAQTTRKENQLCGTITPMPPGPRSRR